MDVLKDIAGLPLKVLFSKPLVCVLVVIGAAGLLWLPGSWLRPMGLDVWREENLSWIGLVWWVYVGAVVYHLAKWGEGWWKNSRGVRGRKRKMKARFAQLTAGQKAVLSRFVEGNRSYLDLPTNSDDVRELVMSGILVSPYVYNVDPDFDSYGTYGIDEWARGYVMKNQGLIWLEADEMGLVDRRLWGERRSGF